MLSIRHDGLLKLGASSFAYLPELSGSIVVGYSLSTTGDVTEIQPTVAALEELLR